MNFGDWLPDLVPYNHAGLVTARNVYAAPNGYRPLRGLSAITAALSVDWKGGGSFIDLDGTTIMLAGTNSGLYSYGGVPPKAAPVEVLIVYFTGAPPFTPMTNEPNCANCQTVV